MSTTQTATAFTWRGLQDDHIVVSIDWNALGPPYTIALYEHFGFVREGVHKAYALRHGQYHDVLSMARRHPHPPAWS